MSSCFLLPQLASAEIINSRNHACALKDHPCNYSFTWHLSTFLFVAFN